MFRNRGIQVQLVKTPKQTTTPDGETSGPAVDFEKIAKIASDNAKPVLLTIAGAIAANKVLNTACEIAVIAAKAKLK